MGLPSYERQWLPRRTFKVLGVERGADARGEFKRSFRKLAVSFIGCESR